MPATSSTQTLFKKGDRVAFRFGSRNVRGYVLEDRGPFGVHGRRIYRVQLPMDPFDPMELELPEDEIEPDTRVDNPLTTEEITRYLVNGGLLLMLSAGTDGSSARVWLRRDTLGNITHTFVEERGMVGGAAIPPRAVTDGKIFAPLRPQVVQFVRSFDLAEKEANSVVDRVGTRP